jgi:hypothetical protein
MVMAKPDLSRQKWALSAALPPRGIRHAQSKSGHLVGGPFALSRLRLETDQQIERMVALRKLRIATIVIPRLMKLIC